MASARFETNKTRQELEDAKGQLKAVKELLEDKTAQMEELRLQLNQVEQPQGQLSPSDEAKVKLTTKKEFEIKFF